jgi:hypothetical protein
MQIEYRNIEIGTYATEEVAKDGKGSILIKVAPKTVKMAWLLAFLFLTRKAVRFHPDMEQGARIVIDTDYLKVGSGVERGMHHACIELAPKLWRDRLLTVWLLLFKKPLRYSAPGRIYGYKGD